MSERGNLAPHTRIDWFLFFSFVFFIGFSFISFFFVPAAMIYGHFRINNLLLARASALLGAIFAIFLGIPKELVIFSFVLGLLVSDYVLKPNGTFFRLLIKSLFTLKILALIFLLLLAYSEKIGIYEYWIKTAENAAAYLTTSQLFSNTTNSSELSKFIVFEGPFLYLSAVSLSVWFSVGLCSHFSLFKENHWLNAESLRKISISPYIGISYLVFWILRLLNIINGIGIIPGIFDLIGVFLFIQGNIYLSKILLDKKIMQPSRTLIYSISLSFGFYVILVLGIVFPWINLLLSTFLSKKYVGGKKP